MRHMKVLGAVLAVCGLAGGSIATASATTAHHQTASHATSMPKPACPARGVSGLDIVWLKTSAQGDVFEIQGGQQALKKSTNPAVRTLAQTLISDHTKSLEDAKHLADIHGITLELSPTPEQQWILKELGELSGAKFDHDYSEAEVLDHQQDIQEAQDEVDLGCDVGIHTDAEQEIPMLQKHLQLSQAALKASPEPSSWSTSSSKSKKRS